MSSKKITVGLAITLAGFVAPTAAAWAAHDHYVLTPNGKCHQVASGQTGIADPAHGGYHRFHVNVHLGATESDTAPDRLGDGRSAVSVYREGPAPAICDGS